MFEKSRHLIEFSLDKWKVMFNKEENKLKTETFYVYSNKIVFSIYFYGGNIKHTQQLTTPLRGQNRIALKKQLAMSYATDVQVQLRKDCDLNLKKDGNLDGNF